MTEPRDSDPTTAALGIDRQTARSSRPDTGFDPSFLGVDVPLPSPIGGIPALVDLPYHHFSVQFRTDRKLAAYSAVNIDGATLVDVARSGDTWLIDDRLPAAEQADNDLYRSNNFDRGHLTRRRDPVWGNRSEAEAANRDTFHYTNAAPQVAVFNQSKELWLGLEDYVLGHAETYRQRLSVITGPVLLDDDPEYRGVQIPGRFFKIAAWSTTDTSDETGTETLAAAGYLLDQSDLIGDVIRTGALEEPPPLGAYRTFQVAISDIAALTRLELPELVAADVLATGGYPTGRADRWISLAKASDMVLP